MFKFSVSALISSNASRAHFQWKQRSCKCAEEVWGKKLWRNSVKYSHKLSMPRSILNHHTYSLSNSGTHAHKNFVGFFHQEGDRCAPQSACDSFCGNSQISEFAIKFCPIYARMSTFVTFLFMPNLLDRICRVCAPILSKINRLLYSLKDLCLSFHKVYM